jgi:hypothetical protein
MATFGSGAAVVTRSCASRSGTCWRVKARDALAPKKVNPSPRGRGAGEWDGSYLASDAITSISTFTSRGSRETCTVARAGNGAVNCCA